MNVKTGAILAAASLPTYDPADLANADRWASLRTDPRAPLLDRVTAAAAPPGSVFKPVVVAAALEEGAATGDGVMYCQGYLNRPDRRRCACFVAQGVGHGRVTAADALCRSCNVWCFDAADRLSGDALADWSARFGFGVSPGTGLPGERAGGVMPLRESEEEPSRDLRIETGVGQGRVTASPLQVCRMAAAIANGGTLVTPQVAFVRPRGNAPPRGDGEPVGLSPSTLKTLRDGLDRAVNTPSGTGYRFARSERLRVAGKTGTAQTGGGRASHAWFAGYGTLPGAEAPAVAVCVWLEHGGSGGSAAGPVAKDLLEAWVEAETPSSRAAVGTVRRVQ